MSHNHAHHPTNYNRAFAIGVILNLGFVIIEAVYGVMADSLALIADAGHNLSDVAALLLAWGGAVLAAKSSPDRHTYGYRKATIMASLASAIILLVALGGIAWESIGRLNTPEPVNGPVVVIVAGIGVVINTVTALLFYKGQRHDLNIRGAFLHMAADAAISLGVVVSGGVIMATGWLQVDPLVSLLIVAIIFYSTWGLLKESIHYSLDAAPKGVDIQGIKDYLTQFDSVDHYHDFHVWPISTSEIALTVHLVVKDEIIDNNFLMTLQQHLHDKFGIEHATIQVESVNGGSYCLLNKPDCIQP